MFHFESGDPMSLHPAFQRSFFVVDIVDLFEISQS